jgi:HEAT repeat protein
MLVKMAQAEDAVSRQQAVQALGALRIGDEATVKALTCALDDPIPSVRAAAVRSFSLLPWRAPAAVPQLLPRLKDDSPEVRQWTAKLLGEIGSAARVALPDLQRLAAQNDEQGVRAAAVLAVQQIESTR